MRNHTSDERASRRLLIVVAPVLLLLGAGVLSLRVIRNLRLWKKSTELLRPHRFELGRVDLGSVEPQLLQFEFSPDRTNPQMLTLGFRNAGSRWEHRNRPLFGCKIVLRDSHGEEIHHFRATSRQYCNWHKPDPDAYLGELPVDRLTAGEMYVVEFTMQADMEVSPGLETILYGTYQGMWDASRDAEKP